MVPLAGDGDGGDGGGGDGGGGDASTRHPTIIASTTALSAYVARVKGTEIELVPVLQETMDALEAAMNPGVEEYNKAQAEAKHRVSRNEAIAAGGLTDEEQKLVLEIHRLVDE